MRRLLVAGVGLVTVVMGAALAGCGAGSESGLMSEEQCHAAGGIVEQAGDGLACRTGGGDVVAVRAASGVPSAESTTTGTATTTTAVTDAASPEARCRAGGGTVELIPGSAGLVGCIIDGRAREVWYRAGCRPDRTTGRTLAKVYDDGVGDAAAETMQGVETGHGDIGEVEISDSQGVVTLRVTVQSLRASNDTVLIDIDTDCDGADEFGFSFDGSGVAGLNRYHPEGGDDLDLPASVVRSGDTYTLRFSSAELANTTAFSFWAHVNTQEMGVVSDVAPDEEAQSDRWYYDLTSR